MIIKLFTILFLFYFTFIFCFDTSSPCIPTSEYNSYNTTPGDALEANSWTDITVGVNNSISIPFNGTAGDDDNLFVLAVRPGGDAAGSYAQVRVNAFNSTNYPFGCAAIQEGQEGNDMDFHCYSLIQSVLITATNVNVTSTAEFQIYAGFAEGTVGSCTASYVPEGGVNYVWIVLGIVLGIIVIAAIAGVGFFIYKRRQKKKPISEFDIYEEAEDYE